MRRGAGGVPPGDRALDDGRAWASLWVQERRGRAGHVLPADPPMAAMAAPVTKPI